MEQFEKHVEELPGQDVTELLALIDQGFSLIGDLSNLLASELLSQLTDPLHGAGGRQ